MNLKLMSRSACINKWNNMTATEPSTREILQAQKGSVSAFENIVTFYSAKIYNFAYRFTYDRDEAQDLAQEVFLRLYAKLREFDPSRPFRPWFYKLAVNVCINAVRGRKQEAAAQDPEILDTRRANGRAADPAAVAATRDEVARLQHAVAGLPEDYRSAVVLRYLEDMSCEEVADALGVPEGTVKTWLFRAREMLRLRLADERNP